jgi:Membrane bound O-acyl transferase family
MTPFERMLVIIVALFLTMKLIVLAATRVRLAPAGLTAFFLFPGMRPATFASRRHVDRVRTPLLRGTRNLLLGAALFVVARAIAPRSLLAAVIVALPALSLMLHFGLLALATAFWRWNGYPAEELFRQPWRSASLAEFWSRRWNVGFSDMVAVAVQRPVGARWGRRAAIVGSFLASGLLHEMAISVPAGGGYGLPMLYFAAHGALVAADVRGRVAMWIALLAPLPILFHPPFIRAIIVPLLLR